MKFKIGDVLNWLRLKKPTILVTKTKHNYELSKKYKYSIILQLIIYFSLLHVIAVISAEMSRKHRQGKEVPP